MARHRVGRTRLGVAYRSKLGVLTRPTGGTLYIVIADTAEHYYQFSPSIPGPPELILRPDLWAKDLDEYEAFRAERIDDDEPFKYIVPVMDIPKGESQNSVYTALAPDILNLFGTPDGTQFVTGSRPVVLSDLTSAFDVARNKQRNPKRVVVLRQRDTNGMFPPHDHAYIPDATGAFREWLKKKDDEIDLQVQEFFFEGWLAAIKTGFVAFGGG